MGEIIDALWASGVVPRTKRERIRVALMVEQDGRCAVCQKRFEDINQDRAPALDHNHACCPKGKDCDMCRRGALCAGCNLGLGCFNDEIDALTNAIAYLEFWKVQHSRVSDCDHAQQDGCHRCCTYCDYEDHKCDQCDGELDHLHCGHSATATCHSCAERDRLSMGDGRPTPASMWHEEYAFIVAF